MKSFRGIIHLHSKYSPDGHHDLAEIAHFGRDRGYHFFAMSEHSDTLDEAGVFEYVESCERISSEDFLLIPGIEFSCTGGIHILGLGVSAYSPSTDPLEVAEFIRHQRGVSIIAHPIRNHCSIPEELLWRVDGVEIWNVVYDGRFVPNPGVIQWFLDSREKGLNLIGYGGQDLHRITDHMKLETNIPGDYLSVRAILNALRTGNFSISNSWIKLDPRVAPSGVQWKQITFERWGYERLKQIRDRFVRKV